ASSIRNRSARFHVKSGPQRDFHQSREQLKLPSTLSLQQLWELSLQSYREGCRNRRCQYAPARSLDPSPLPVQKAPGLSGSSQSCADSENSAPASTGHRLGCRSLGLWLTASSRKAAA